VSYRSGFEDGQAPVEQEILVALDGRVVQFVGNHYCSFMVMERLSVPLPCRD
jgi:hypothetical protein